MIDIGKAYAARAALVKQTDDLVVVDQVDGKWVLKQYGATDTESIEGVPVVSIKPQSIENRHIDEVKDESRKTIVVRYGDPGYEYPYENGASALMAAHSETKIETSEV